MKIELKEIQDNPEILEFLSRENQEIIITKNAQPIYKLTRINQSNTKRRNRGTAKGLITMSSDFDEPLPEFTEYM
ncbi:MAG: type II toxin-antitoxin system Phd/YefM family antitoxin [Crocosphaera sp.]